jgi:hypothetical protein
MRTPYNVTLYYFARLLISNFLSKIFSLTASIFSVTVVRKYLSVVRICNSKLIAEGLYRKI